MLEVAKFIKKQYEGRIAAVTFMGAEPEFQAVFGKRNVRHFGALRGTNDLESAECLIVAGGFCPPMDGVINLAAALHPERMEPFVRTDAKGKKVNPWGYADGHYRLRVPDSRGEWPIRKTAGFTDPDLSVVLEEFRRNEIVQAMHRVRPNLKNSVVWLLTSVPTGEPLDGIYEDLSELDWTPVRVKDKSWGVPWRRWLSLYEWMDEQWGFGKMLTKQDLATQTGVSLSTVQNAYWIECLDRFYVDKSKQWKLVLKRLVPHHKRKSAVLEPVREEG